ncbi:MAG: calcium/sodium antiporter [Rubrobacteraceae bacterium]
MSPLALVLFVAGIALLIFGAELLVRGASRLAESVGISPVVVGLTVVAFGTSSPETAVTVQSAFSGNADIALGNVVGSNILNVLFVLGISAVILPLTVSRRLVRLDVPILVVASVLLLILSLDGEIGKFDGLVLFAGIVAYTAFSLIQSRLENGDSGEAQDDEPGWMNSRVFQLCLIALGLGMLILGSRWLVSGAVEIATALGVSQLVIGLTVVAFGTSMPEVATSVVAAFRGQRDMAVGNAVGSCLFNILAVLGISSLVAPDALPVPASAISFDIPVMIATAVACLPIFFTGSRIARREGLLFLGYYAAYATYLLLNSTSHDALPAFSFVMLAFVIPLTGLTLLAASARSLRIRWQRRKS